MIFTSPFARVVTLNNKQKYFCYFVHLPHCYVVHKIVASLIIMLMTKKQNKVDLINIIVQQLGQNLTQASTMLDDLIYKKILRTSELNAEEKTLLQKINSYKLKGWNNSLAYHFSTLNYPFIDYSTGDGYLIDQQRMQEYYSKEDDISRYKEYEAFEKIKGNNPYETSFDNKGLEKDNVMSLLSLTLGKLFEVHNLKLKTPVFKKVVPSGGARHPTEAYIISNNIEGLDIGVYHYNCNDYSLNNLDIPFDNNKIEELMFTYDGYVGFKPHASIILTSVFERNMFRYREPRTFRTIYLDVGHILSVMIRIAKILKFNYKCQYNHNQKAIEKFLQLSPFEEGVMVILHLR